MAILKPDKEERAVESATNVFTRYGYARTTMADIAAGAGMSRPALYLLFPDKEAIFERVIAEMDARKLAEIKDLLSGEATLGDKLMHACLNWGMHGVEIASAHPDAADLFDLRFPAVRRVYANFEAFVAELIGAEIERSGIDASAVEVARALVFGMRGMREASATEEEMRRLLSVLVKAFVTALHLESEGAVPSPLR